MALPALRVLSLDVALLRPLPHALAGLQHLVLRVGGDAATHAADAQPGHGLFSTLAGSLLALRTLYIAAVVPCCIPGPVDLTPCGQLAALALAAIHVEEGMAVPAGCHVAAVLPADAVRALRVWTGDIWTGAALERRMNALDLRGVRTSNDALAHSGLRALSVSMSYKCLTALRELRIVLDFASLPGGIEDRVSLKMDSARLPALRVLEVDIPCTLSLRLAWVARGGRRAGQGGRLARAHWRGRDAARCAPRPAPSRPPCEHVWTLCTLAVRLPATHCRSLLARIG